MGADDSRARMAINAGLVPKGCILPGPFVLSIVAQRKDPCAECNNNRDMCGGRPKGEQAIENSSNVIQGNFPQRRSTDDFDMAEIIPFDWDFK